MNAPFQVRQLAQYGRTDAAIPGTVTLMQMGEAGTPYASILTRDLVTSALAGGGDLNLLAGSSSIVFGFDQGAGAVTLSVVQGELQVSPSLRTSTVDAAFVKAASVSVNGSEVVTQAQLAVTPIVSTFNFRSGDVQLETPDILRAGGAPIRDAHFGGWITAPSVWDTRQNDDTVATTNWVHRLLCSALPMTTAQLNAIYAVPGPPYPSVPSPVLGDASNRIATTAFVDDTLDDYAPLISPHLTGIPTAPTPLPASDNTQIATTAYVDNAVGAAAAGMVNVKSFGAVGNASYPQGGSVLTTVTANGTNVLTAVSVTGTPAVGHSISSVNWHSLGLAALPFPTTVTAVSGFNITVSQAIPAGTYPMLVTWAPINATTVTGNDDTSAIKAAIDYALQNKISDVYLPSGVYLISDTLQLGYGDNYYSVHLIGSERAPYTSSTAGAVIVSIATNRPAINIQGGRMSLIRGIFLIGPGANFTTWAQTFANTFSSDPVDWLSPLLYATGSSPGGLQQHSPLVGISVDAFAGAPPAAPYVQTIPPWTGLTGTYNRLLSSDTTINEVWVQGFGVAIAAGLNSASQGDFLRVKGGSTQSCPYGICVGNNQSRNVHILDVNFQGHYCFIDGSIMGMQQGEFVGPINNCSGGEVYSLINITNATISGPIRVSNCYMENSVRIGNFAASSSFNSSIAFDSCFFQFTETLHNQIPSGYLTVGGNAATVFRNCTINGNKRINSLINSGFGELTVDGCNFYMATGGPGGSAALQSAINFCGGCLPGSPRYNAYNIDATHYIGGALMSYFATPSGGVTVRTHSDDLRFYTTSAGVAPRVPMTAVAKSFVDSAFRRWNFQKLADALLTMTAISQVTVPPSWTNDTMTFTLASGTYAGVGSRLAPGWMLYHLNSGTIFVVTAVGAVDGSGNYPITTVQQNNLFANGSTGAFIKNTLPDSAAGFVNPLAGSTVLINATVILPKQVYYGTFSNSSSTVATVHRGDNYGGDIATYWIAGDVVNSMQFNDATNPSWPLSSNALPLTVSTVTPGSPATIVLSGTPANAGRFPVYPICIR